MLLLSFAVVAWATQLSISRLTPVPTQDLPAAPWVPAINSLRPTAPTMAHIPFETAPAAVGNTWHTLTSDHTGNPQGYFMLVNASFQPSDFYVDTVRNLCARTTYEFAAWLLNMVKSPGSIMPNITFSIELPNGTVLQKVNTGNIPATASPQWKQYGFWFSTPPGIQTLVLRITNNAPGGIGNDLALDDITFRPCGPEIKANIAGHSDSIDICEDEIGEYTLEAEEVSGYNKPSARTGYRH